MLKAVELELTDDMEDVVAGANATRGNTAILLWNMLRTNMWRIAAESEKNGMTLTENDSTMLEIKFPDYDYVKTIGNAKATLGGITITDKDEVKATLLFDGDELYEGTISNIDLSKIVVGMEVEALVRDYKKPEKTAILTLTPAHTIVAGFVTDLTYVERGNYYTFKVDGVEYRFEEGFEVLDDVDFVADDAYIVFEANGKKVVNNVYDILPTTSRYLEAQSEIDGLIDEDDLVIIDGVWGEQKDVKEGSIVVEIEEGERFGFDGYYFEVTSETKNVTFDVMFDEKEDWLGGKEVVEYITLDNDDLRTAEGFEAKEGEKNNKNVDPDLYLKVAYKDNEYSDTKVEAFYNYLGMVARVHFGDAEKGSSNAGFYAVTSNGAWSEGSNKGKVYNLDLVGQDGKENEYKTVVDPKINNDDEDKIISNEGVYQDEVATFIWADFDDNDEKIETIVVLDAGIPAYEKGVDRPEDTEDYRAKFDIVDASNIRIDGKKLYDADDEEMEDLRLGGTTYFYEAVAIKNEKNTKVVGFDVTVTTDKTEYDGLTLPEGSLMAIKEGKVRYVFIPGEATTGLLWGRLGAINISKETVKIDTSAATKLGTDDDTIEDSDNVVEGALVGYRESKDGKTARIYDVLPLADNVNNPNIGIFDGEADVDADDDFIPLVGGEKFDTDASDHKDEKKVPVYKVTLQYKVSTGIAKVVSVKKVGEGRQAIQENAKSWDRIVAYPSEEDVEAYFIFTGMFDSKNAEDDDFVFSPEYVDEEEPEEPTPEEPTVEDPTVEDPTVEEPTVEEPTTEEPTTTQPEEPTTEEPTTEEPTTTQPEEPTVEEPTTEEPTTTQPEEPTVEEPTTEAPTTEEPTV
jgi:hypothetical protein